METLERHPWNRAFSWEAPAGPFRALTEEQARQFSDLGFVVLSDVIDLAVIEEVRDELDVDPLGWECLTDLEEVTPAPVRAGGVVVFSSLTPHLTGPNTTDAVRKAYILQFAPMGAEILRGDPGAGSATERETTEVAERQYAVLRDGQRVEPPPLPTRE